ncbi:MAG: tripartite tricarboxylate transporter TctB family protein [bacterium]|nr:tripartite tricarboxylate transporter TctB family protein [bacterium]
MNRAGGVVLFLLAVLYGFEARSFNVRFVADPIGPKAFPYIAALLLAGVGLYLVFLPGASAATQSGARIPRLALCAASLVVYALLLDPLGYIAATALEMTALALLLGAPVKRGVLAALVFSTLTFVLFDRLLEVPLPLGGLFS